jgi:hypothetical protein
VTPQPPRHNPEENAEWLIADSEKAAEVWHAPWARGLDYPTKGADRKRTSGWYWRTWRGSTIRCRQWKRDGKDFDSGNQWTYFAMLEVMLRPFFYGAQIGSTFRLEQLEFRQHSRQHFQTSRETLLRSPEWSICPTLPIFSSVAAIRPAKTGLTRKPEASDATVAEITQHHFLPKFRVSGGRGRAMSVHRGEGVHFAHPH